MIVCPWKEIGRYAAVIPGLEEAVKAVSELTDLTPRTVPLSGRNKILVQEGTTKAAEGQLLEAHREFLDIQYILEGGETVGWAPIDTLELDGEFNTTKDKGMYAGSCDFMDIRAGYCYVVFPEDAHMPGSHLTSAQQYKKLVIKLEV
jgi:YhcH/YjgK/YiaL family protein